MLAEGIRSIVEIKFSVGIIEQKRKGDIRSSATSEAALLCLAPCGGIFVL